MLGTCPRMPDKAHDLPIGAKTRDTIDEAIRLREKLLLILSKASIASEWVEDEVNKAYAEERPQRGSSYYLSASTTP